MLLRVRIARSESPATVAIIPVDISLLTPNSSDANQCVSKAHLAIIFDQAWAAAIDGGEIDICSDRKDYKMEIVEFSYAPHLKV